MDNYVSFIGFKTNGDFSIGSCNYRTKHEKPTGDFSIGSCNYRTKHEKPTGDEIDKCIDDLKRKNGFSSVFILNMIPVYEEEKEE